MIRLCKYELAKIDIKRVKATIEMAHHFQSLLDIF